MSDSSLLTLTDYGLYCAAGDFFIDPWKPVKRAVVTHAHADHYARGCGAYLVAAPGERIFRLRLGDGAVMNCVPFGEMVDMQGVTVSLHPAGHILGSAQIRVEHRGEVWVVSGDYKREADPTCAPFEVVPCHTFITEATFGLPIYRWQPQREIFEQINQWWRGNQAAGKASIILGYALGKAQRIIAGVDPAIGSIYTHGAVEQVTRAYRQSGVQLTQTTYVKATLQPDWTQALIVAPPSAQGSVWTRQFGNQSSAFVSGWMRLRGTRRRRAVDRGFVLSDHVDWTDLIHTISDTGAERIGVTHGYVAPVTRWLTEQGYDAFTIGTRFAGEEGDADDKDDDTNLD
jgi:putative mRNA 3-end processing factor